MIDIGHVLRSGELDAPSIGIYRSYSVAALAVVEVHCSIRPRDVELAVCRRSALHLC